MSESSTKGSNGKEGHSERCEYEGVYTDDLESHRGIKKVGGLDGIRETRGKKEEKDDLGEATAVEENFARYAEAGYREELRDEIKKEEKENEKRERESKIIEEESKISDEKKRSFKGCELQISDGIKPQAFEREQNMECKDSSSIDLQQSSDRGKLLGDRCSKPQNHKLSYNEVSKQISSRKCIQCQACLLKMNDGTIKLIEDPNNRNKEPHMHNFCFDEHGEKMKDEDEGPFYLPSLLGVLESVTDEQINYYRPRRPDPVVPYVGTPGSLGVSHSALPKLCEKTTGGLPVPSSARDSIKNTNLNTGESQHLVTVVVKFWLD